MLRIFGRAPAGRELQLIKNSPNYHNGSFHNQSPTEVLLKGVSVFKILKGFINKPRNVRPAFTLPTIKTDLKSIRSDKPVIIWFGHSSCFISYRNTTILIDPVLSRGISPVSFFGKAFRGSDVYSADDFPPIDILILTHDHYDHLDYKTLHSLSGKIRQIFAPLGLSSHLTYWGFDEAIIRELDWWDKVLTKQGFELISTPARHFSGRGIKRNQTLWTSYVLKMDTYSLFLGGDSGYDSHFKEIGNQYGPFDIVFLESGQYNKLWPFIHMMPEEAVRAAIELKAKLLLPVHWGKFALAFHDWDEPVKRVLKEAAKQKLKVCTPLIGEPVVLGEQFPERSWWIRPNDTL